MDNKKICKNCGKELPSDSKFCQYCGSKDILDLADKDFEKITVCKNCKKEIPSDSEFCQYCGSNEKEEILTKKRNVNNGNINLDDKNKKNEKTSSNVWKVLFFLLLAFDIIFVIYACSTYQETDQEINNNATDTINTILNNIDCSYSYKDFYVSKTALHNPVNEKVYVTLKHTPYQVFVEASDGITCTWDDGWDETGVTIGLTVTADDTVNVGYINLSNDYNDEVVAITVIGDISY